LFATNATQNALPCAKASLFQNPLQIANCWRTEETGQKTKNQNVENQIKKYFTRAPRFDDLFILSSREL